jgi:purine-binding chemotaxis protein CheW
MSTTDDREQTQYLTFLIAEEEYAIGILRVREIIQYETVTRVPRMPPWIRGVINLRGGVVPVLDLAIKLGLPRSAVTKETCIVITEVEVDGLHNVMGIVADSVSQVIDLSAHDIEPPPAFGTRIRVDYLLGMGKAGKKFVLILDTDRVLSADELLAASEASREEADGAAAPSSEGPGESSAAASA